MSPSAGEQRGAPGRLVGLGEPGEHRLADPVARRPGSRRAARPDPPAGRRGRRSRRRAASAAAWAAAGPAGSQDDVVLGDRGRRAPRTAGRARPPRPRRSRGTPSRSGSGRRCPCRQDRRVAPDVLVHLIEPADWRAALTDGAVRPPSLDVGRLRAPLPARAGAPAGRAALPRTAGPGAAGGRPGAADRPGPVRGRASRPIPAGCGSRTSTGRCR